MSHSESNRPLFVSQTQSSQIPETQSAVTTEKSQSQSQSPSPTPNEELSETDVKPSKAPSGKPLPRATLEQKVKVIDWHTRHGAKSQRFTVQYFKNLNEFSITTSAFNRWLKDKVQLRSDLARSTHLSTAKFKKRSYVKYAMVDHCVSRQYEQWLFEYEKFTQQDLKNEWFHYAKLLYPDEEFDEELDKTNGWLFYFHKKMKAKKEVIQNHQNYLIANFREDIDGERQRIKNAIAKFKPCDVFHIDEFAVTTRILPNEHIAQKFIVGIGVNSDVTEFLPPFIVSRDRALEEHEFYFQSNTNQLTVEIFYKYLTKINKHIAFHTPDRKILILLDRLHEHVVRFDDFFHIDVCWFNANFQTLYSNLDDHYGSNKGFGREIQPLNLGIVKNFKLHYKTNLMKHYISTVQIAKYLSENSSDASSELPTLQISNDLVYELIVSSYEHIKSTKFHDYIRKCWQISNILPWYDFKKNVHNVYNVVDDDKMEILYYKLIRALDHCGYLQTRPTFTLDQLMFPRDEHVINLHLSRMDVVTLVKLEAQYIQRPYQLGEKPEDETRGEGEDGNDDDSYRRADIISQLNSIDPLLSTQLKPFFEENRKQFPNSNKLFQKFLNTYIIESIDYQYTDTAPSK